MGFLSVQLRLFVVALGRYTRFPVADWRDADVAEARHAIRFLPAVGVVVGACCALVYAVAIRWFPPAIAVLFSMIAGLLLTGAVHERGFAYVCDLWGEDRNAAAETFAPKPAWPPADRAAAAAPAGSSKKTLGAAGAVGGAMLLLLKFAMLAYLDDFHVVVALLCGHALSRFAPLPVLWAAPRTAGERVSPAIGWGELPVAAVYGFLPLVLILRSIGFAPVLRGPLLIGAGLALAATVAVGLRVRRDGVSENHLGAIQQIAETAFYAGLLVGPR